MFILQFTRHFNKIDEPFTFFIHWVSWAEFKIYSFMLLEKVWSELDPHATLWYKWVIFDCTQNAELEARIQKLKDEQAQREYDHMTHNVRGKVGFMQSISFIVLKCKHIFIICTGSMYYGILTLWLLWAIPLAQ